MLCYILSDTALFIGSRQDSRTTGSWIELSCQGLVATVDLSMYLFQNSTSNAYLLSTYIININAVVTLVGRFCLLLGQ